jgi:general secretion pathway protein H
MHRPPRRLATTSRRGFTLIELLVVMVIAGIIVSMVAINASPGERGRLLDDGQRIARLFELAQEEAQLGARPLAWEGDAQGWRFYRSTPDGWVMMRNDVFAPGHWRLQPDQVQITEGARLIGNGSPPRLVFGRELIEGPQRLVVVRGTIRVDIVGDGSGQYTASAP